MIKRIVYLILAICIIVLSGCEKQNYKRIIAEEGVEWGRETLIFNDSYPEEIYLELDDNDIFYPSFFHNGYIYGHIRKLRENEGIEKKYLYRIDVNNKISETVKENFNNLSGSKAIGFVDNQIYTVNYNRGNRLYPMTLLSSLLVNNRNYKEENQYEMYYVPGNDNYIVIYEFKPNRKLSNIYIFDMVLGKFYEKLADKKHGEIAYLRDLNSLIWIDQEDFKLYKIRFINGYYTLDEYMDLELDEAVDRTRVYINNGYELILLCDSKIVDNTEWDLMETIEVRTYRFRANQNLTLFKKSTTNNLYFEYLGDNIFLSEAFELKDGYIEIRERQVFYYNYKELNSIYFEVFNEKSQQLYPEINVIASRTSNEMFSTREIKEIIDGVPVTKKVIYQRIRFDLGNEKLLQ